MNALRLDEVFAMVSVKLQMRNVRANHVDPANYDQKFCYDTLPHVSRSFAMVIVQLDVELRDTICLFYLVLRALDTIEDDMAVSIATKMVELPVFHRHLFEPVAPALAANGGRDKARGWCMHGVGKGHEALLLEEYYRICSEVQRLKPEYQVVIADICERMANGMCKYLEREVRAKAEYDEYCHFVAGLVGHGLTRLFAASGLEPTLAAAFRHKGVPSAAAVVGEAPADGEAEMLATANHMGLFLQKTNIIRDYLEDLSEDPPRVFWPREMWSGFTDDLHKFKQPSHRGAAKECLTAMVADALTHVPHVVRFMSCLSERSVFFFCAIPQVMAIATLALLLKKPDDVFTSKVKIRKGLACKILRHCGSLQDALRQFSFHIDEAEAALVDTDPSFDACRAALAQSRAHIAAHLAIAPAKTVDADEAAPVAETSYARSFITRYPALGGRLLYSIVDGVSGYFRPQPVP